MKAHTQYLSFETAEREEFINITNKVSHAVAASTVQEGLVLVSSLHVTSAVYMADRDEGLIEEIRHWLGALAPQSGDATTDNAGNRLRTLLLHNQVVLPITRGRLEMGTNQQVYYAEMDGQRKKRVIIKIIGE